MSLNKNLAFGFLIFFLTLTFVVASSDNTQWQSALNNSECKLNFSMGVVNLMSSFLPNYSFAQYTTKLQSDFSQLQGYVLNDNQSLYRNYINSQFDPDLKATSEAVQEYWRTPAYNNLTRADKLKFRAGYNSLKTNYDVCFVGSLRNLGGGRINNFYNEIRVYQNESDKLAAKGVDVSALNQILSDAKSQIQVVQSKLNTATTPQEVQQAIQSFCLFDGCENGTNFHLEAKWDIAKLNIALTRIQNNTNSTNFSDNITQLETAINNAKSALTSVGTSSYTDVTKKEVWDNIKLAENLILEITKLLRGIKIR